LVGKVSRQVPNQLDLFFNREPTDDRLENGADCDSVFPDQTAVIHVGENAHQKLAVHSISHSSMPGNAVAKIFHVERPLKPGGKKATEWGDKGRKNGHDENVQVVGRVGERRNVPAQYASQEDPEGGPDFPLPPNENRVGVALDIAPGVYPKTMPKSIVLKKAPTKPSTVFFGESLMRGVRPMVIPQT